MTDKFERAGHSIDLGQLHKSLRAWGEKNRRDFPWRKTRDPYLVLVAEYMLIRTGARQVAPVYKDFVDQYPEVDSLAVESRERIRKAMRPLGLVWRANSLHEAAEIIVRDYNGDIPCSLEDLLSLPGASQYVAGAVRCFALGQAEPLVDANTVRISGRVFGLEIKGHSRRTKQFQSMIAGMLDRDHPREYNLDMLDLGALVCTSRSVPDCEHCPILEHCAFGKEKMFAADADNLR